MVNYGEIAPFDVATLMPALDPCLEICVDVINHEFLSAQGQKNYITCSV